MPRLADDQTVLESVGHRPWPLPPDPWIARQTWRDLMFAHWPVSRDLLRERVPSRLEIDTFDGQAWLGVIPFRVTDWTARGIPAIPWISSYNELNVRTYVVYQGIPGVYFFSLDADSTIAVAGATALFHLPYYLAQMTVEDDRNYINFQSRRVGSDEVEFRARYGTAGPSFEPKAQTLEHWLTERYCLYAVDSANRAYRVEIHHLPWQLQSAEATITANTMPTAARLQLPSMAPLLHFSRRQDTLIWLPRGLS
jgi:uncharacterized protein YqjF (DUF2071 family)